MKKKVIYNKENGVGKIILNDPDRFNPFDDEMADSLMEVLEEAESDDEAKIVTITGAGKAFCGGGDVKRMYEQYNESGTNNLYGLAKKVGEIALYMKQYKKLIVVGAHNAAAGAGFNLALAGDFIIAEEGTRFIQAFVNLGLVPDTGGLYLLSKAVGTTKALHYGVTGHTVTAEQGKDDGFVYQLADRGTITEATQSLAERFVNGPLKAYELIKQQAYEASFTDMPEYIEKEARLQEEACQTDDFYEGIQAFVEKREADFSGK